MASLTRTFSSETYDKMLANPNLHPDQRRQIENMRARRAMKESGAAGSGEAPRADQLASAPPLDHSQTVRAWLMGCDLIHHFTVRRSAPPLLLAHPPA